MKLLLLACFAMVLAAAASTVVKDIPTPDCLPDNCGTTLR